MAIDTTLMIAASFMLLVSSALFYSECSRLSRLIKRLSELNDEAEITKDSFVSFMARQAELKERVDAHRARVEECHRKIASLDPSDEKGRARARREHEAG